ncbi:hypothetical protein [Halogeometricum limi]|uniref:Uncharacterized protein n=1 Tax=Halogeometricum limi TaxID=555875 RepID=A0A1I6IA75_9EURY|nr:hypothetical protein [Halogeometricum limi]SFR63534.1 hypothetical protein SAMN04488124_2915 [Halogeometricum limi]
MDDAEEPDDTPFADLTSYCEFGPERVYVYLAVARTKENEGLTQGTEVTF